MPTLTVQKPGSLVIALAIMAFGLSAPSAEAKAKRHDRHGSVKHTRSVVAVKPSKQGSVPVPEAKSAPAPVTEGSGTWTAGDTGERSCSRGRRKLWQPGEGWMVKRVNVCL